MKLPYAALFFCALLLAGSGQAEVSQSPSEQPLIEELLVTAEKVKRDVQDTPIAITALSDNFIRDWGLTGPDDVTAFVPSMSRSTFDVTLRGIGRNFRTLGGDPGIASYYNGIHSEDVIINTTESQLYDLERIEVLRGPQGTLYGRNAIGGVVNFITNQPTGEFSAELLTRFDEHGSQEYFGYLNGPLIKNTLAARLVGTSSDLGAHRDSRAAPGQAPVKDTGSALDQNLALTLYYTPTDSLEFTLRAAHRELDGINQGLVLIGEGEDRDVRSSATCFPEGTNCFAEPSADGTPWARLNSNANQALPVNGDGYGHGIKDESYPDFLPEYDLDVDSVTLDARWHFGYGQYTLRYVGGYYDTNNTADFDSGVPGGRNTCLRPDCSTGVGEEQIREQHFRYDTALHSYTHELQFITNLDGAWNFVGGLYLYHFNQDITFEIADPKHLGTFTQPATYGQWGDLFCSFSPCFSPEQPFGPPQPKGWHESAVNGGVALSSWGGDPQGAMFWSDSESTTDSTAIYGQANYDLNDVFRLTLGARWSRDEKKGDERRWGYFEIPFGDSPSLDVLNFLMTTETDGSPNGEPLRLLGMPITFQDGVDIKDSWEQPTFRINLDWRPAANTLGYASITSGYRSGGFNLGTDNQRVSYDPETVVSYEAGLKAELFDRSLRLNAAVYLYDYEDHQVHTVVPFTAEDAGCTECQNPDDILIRAATQNVPESESWGVELEGIWAVTPNLQVGGVYSYMKSKITDDFLVSMTGNSYSGELGSNEIINVKGNELNRAPRHKYTLWGSYTWPLGRHGTLDLLSSIAYTDTQYQDVHNIPINRLPEFYRWDARLTWNSPTDRFRLAVFGRNLTEDFGLLDLQGDQNLARTSLTTAPRSIGVEFRVRFGSWSSGGALERGSNLPEDLL